MEGIRGTPPPAGDRPPPGGRDWSAETDLDDDAWPPSEMELPHPDDIDNAPALPASFTPHPALYTALRALASGRGWELRSAISDDGPPGSPARENSAVRAVQLRNFALKDGRYAPLPVIRPDTEHTIHYLAPADYLADPEATGPVWPNMVLAAYLAPGREHAADPLTDAAGLLGAVLDSVPLHHRSTAADDSLLQKMHARTSLGLPVIVHMRNQDGTAQFRSVEHAAEKMVLLSQHDGPGFLQLSHQEFLERAGTTTPEGTVWEFGSLVMRNHHPSYEQVPRLRAALAIFEQSTEDLLSQVDDAVGEGWTKEDLRAAGVPPEIISHLDERPSH